MAKMKDGIFGGFSGKIGNVVGCKGKTGFYVRSIPQNVKNPRTEQQQAHRKKFALSIRFAQALTPLLRVSYNELASNGRPFYAAVSCFLKNAVVPDGSDYAIDFEKALVSSGTLTAACQAKVELLGNEAAFTWVDNSSDGNASASDVALLVVFNKTRWMAVYNVSAALRSDEKANFCIPAEWCNEELAVYLGFRCEDGKLVANSVCLRNDPILQETFFQ